MFIPLSIVFIVYVLIIVTIYRNKNKIDLVYTWHNSNFKPSNDTRMAYINLEHPRHDAICKERFEENNELKHSLRSIDMYMPWINNIYIVIADDQQPPTFIKENGKIRIVRHSTIFTSRYVIPTYASVNIESSLHHIPGLTEKFIYSNDDIFLAKHVNPSDFFTDDGKPKIWLDKQNVMDVSKSIKDDKIHDIMEYNALCPIYKTGSIKRAHHFFKALSKTMLYKYESKYNDILQNTYRSRFRNEKSIYTLSGASHFGLLNNYAVEGDIPDNIFFNMNGITEPDKYNHIMTRIKKTDPTFICLNNGTSGDAHHLSKIYSELYPKPSKFELEIL